MRPRPAVLLCALLALAVVALDAPAASTRTIVVRNDAGFAAAAAKLRVSGGKIVLARGAYRRLVIGPRGRRPLHIVGRRGARVRNVLFKGTQRVSLGHVTVRPNGGDALVEVRDSRHVDLHDLVFTARGTRSSSSILLSVARNVTIRGSDFSHCGDRAPGFTYCVRIWRWTHDVTIRGNRFHDCFGCDFVHGRFGTDLTIRNNRFERALPCKMGRFRCGHNDLVQLFRGRRLRVVGNHFGVYREGGAQLYITNAVDYATIVNNVFVGTDPKVPGYRARMGVVIGSNESKRMPWFARVVNNTILTGHRRRDGYSGSLRMSTRYARVSRWKRPIVANNVIALLETQARVCNGAGRFVRNLIIKGRACSVVDPVGPLDLDGRGRPRADSPVVDSANEHYAPRRDVTGRLRDGPPDIGAFEYRP
jgi:hypothetical protein